MRRLAPAVMFLVLAAACTTTSDTTASTSPAKLPVDLLHEAGTARKAMRAIERKVGASTAQVTDILVYPDYMIVDAQDPNALDHINRYRWRDQSVGSPEAVHLSGPQADVNASLFATSVINLNSLPSIVLAAEQRLAHARPLRIEHARGSYVDIQRTTSSALDGRITIHISVAGPRRSGTVDTGSNGEILNTTVS